MNQVEHRRCNNNKNEFLTYAINNNKTIAFEYTTGFYVLSPIRICNFGKSVLMYNEITDTFNTFYIDEMTFYPIPEDLRDETEVETDVDDVDVDDDILSLQSEHESDERDESETDERDESESDESDESEDELDISLLTDMYHW
jgi:hypothetical protein